MEKIIKVGIMPGKLQEIAVTSSTTVQEALDFAGINPDGYEVKLDGTKVTDFSQQIGYANLVLLSKMVKGN